MRSHKFLAGTVTGVALVLLVSGLLLAGLGRQGTSAASGTPETKSTTSAATPGATTGVSKDETNALEQRMITTISDAEWNAAATTLGMSASDFDGAINSGKSVATLGASHNVTTEQVRAAMVAAGSAAVNTAVQNGTITQSEADLLNNGLVAAIADKVTHANADEAANAGTGTPTANQKSTDGQKPAPSTAESAIEDAVSNADFSAMASTLGVSADQLKTAWGNPADLAALATSHHVTVQQLKDALVATGQQALDQAVAHGTVTRTEADSLGTRMVQAMAKKLSGMLDATVATPTP